MSDPLRFFISAEALSENPVKITGDAFHHLSHVLRARSGEQVTLLDGKGNCCAVRLTEITRSYALGDVLQRWSEQEQSLPINLIQALPKGEKLDLILQKGTELGISTFQPVSTRHTIPRPTGSRLVKREERWRKIVHESARQSRRPTLPEVRSVKPLAEVISETNDSLKLVLCEDDSQPLQEKLSGQHPEKVSLLVGPEGGFSPEEISRVIDAGFHAVHLGPRILRTETAGLAATPVLQYLYGDWQQSPANKDNTQYEEKP